MTNTGSESDRLRDDQIIDFVEFLWGQGWSITESANDGSHWSVDLVEILKTYRDREVRDAEDACSGSSSSSTSPS